MEAPLPQVVRHRSLRPLHAGHTPQALTGVAVNIVDVRRCDVSTTDHELKPYGDICARRGSVRSHHTAARGPRQPAGGRRRTGTGVRRNAKNVEPPPTPPRLLLGPSPCSAGAIGSGVRDTFVQGAQYAPMTAAAGALLSGVSHIWEAAQDTALDTARVPDTPPRPSRRLGTRRARMTKPHLTWFIS